MGECDGSVGVGREQRAGRSSKDENVRLIVGGNRRYIGRQIPALDQKKRDRGKRQEATRRGMIEFQSLASGTSWMKNS